MQIDIVITGKLFDFLGAPLSWLHYLGRRVKKRCDYWKKQPKPKPMEVRMDPDDIVILWYAVYIALALTWHAYYRLLRALWRVICFIRWFFRMLNPLQ